jgi:hypothetical protein
MRRHTVRTEYLCTPCLTLTKFPLTPSTLQIPLQKSYADYSKRHSAVNFEKLLKTTSNGSPFSMVRAPPLPQFHIPSIHKVRTYVEYRAVSGVFQNIDPTPLSTRKNSYLIFVVLLLGLSTFLQKKGKGANFFLSRQLAPF